MTNSERLERYFDDLVSSGKLHPGDRLPTYGEISRQFGLPYASVQHAFKVMEQHGKVKILNGVGSFLNGGDALDVEFYLDGNAFGLDAFQSLVDEISQRQDLHLHLMVRDVSEVCSDISDHRVVIAESTPLVHNDGCLLDYSYFPDYAQVMSDLRVLHRGGNQNLMLPFYFFTYQGVANTRLLHRTGMELQGLSDLSFWEELSDRCRQQGIYPGGLSQHAETTWNFPIRFLSCLLRLQELEHGDDVFQAPFYTTPTGQRILRIARDCCYDRGALLPLIEDRAAVVFSVGSWLASQAGPRFGLQDDAFKVLPLRQGSRHLLAYSESFLKTFANPSITQNERERVWRLLKGLLSRPYQKRLCAMSGALSYRRDMKPGDYAWNTRPDYAWFFPHPGTRLVDSNCLSAEKISALSALYELSERRGWDTQLTGELLDSILLKRSTMEP